MYKFENGELVPYMYITNKKAEFAKEEYKAEYEYNGEKEPSWWRKTWNSIIDFFYSEEQSTSEAEIKENEIEDKTSWWQKTKSFVSNLFSSNKDSDEEITH